MQTFAPTCPVAITEYIAIASATHDLQSSGYSLEDLLSELFAVHEITYRPRTRLPRNRLMDLFFKGFDYLVEVLEKGTSNRGRSEF